MFVTMDDAGGVGLAAPQVGISSRFFVMDIPPAEDRVPVRRTPSRVEARVVGEVDEELDPPAHRPLLVQVAVVEGELEQEGEDGRYPREQHWATRRGGEDDPQDGGRPNEPEAAGPHGKEEERQVHRPFGGEEEPRDVHRRFTVRADRGMPARLTVTPAPGS